MVEMRVRYVRRHTPSGNDVAVLGPAVPGAERPMIALTVSRPEAVELADELEQRPTPRSGVYDLLVSILDSAGTTVTSIEVQARLELSGPTGRSEIQVEVGQAISLSVRIGKALQVSERLIEAVTPPALRAPAASAPDPDAPSSAASGPAVEPVSAPSTDVPDRFRRAFEE